MEIKALIKQEVKKALSQKINEETLEMMIEECIEEEIRERVNRVIDGELKREGADIEIKTIRLSDLRKTVSNDHDDLYKRIVEARKASSLKRNEFIDLLTRSGINDRKIIEGILKVDRFPDEAELQKIAQLLKVDLDWLIGKSE